VQINEEELVFEPNELPFKIQSNQEDEEPEKLNDVAQSNYTYKLVSESLIFHEDDRLERPFIVLELTKEGNISHLWVVVINI